MKKAEHDPAGIYKQYWLLKDISKRIQCELGQTPFSKDQYAFLTKFLAYVNGEALAVAALHAHLRSSYTKAHDEKQQEQVLSVVVDGSWPVVMALIADNVFTTGQKEMIVLAYKDLTEVLDRLRQSVGQKSVVDHADFAKRADRRAKDDADPKGKILDRFDAIRKIREHVLWNIGDAPFSETQYDILFSFAAAMNLEERETTKLHPELDRIWNGSDGGMDARQDEGWQDETFQKLLRTRLKPKAGLATMLSSPLLSVRQSAECKAFQKTLTDESERIRLKMHGRCARCDCILERNEIVTIYYSHNDKSKKDQNICSLCNWNEMVEKYQKTGEISSTIMTQAIFYELDKLPKFPTPVGLLEEVCATIQLINKEVERFEEEVWRKWLWKFCCGQKERIRHSMEDKHLKVLVFSGLGRIMITLGDQFHMGHKESIYNGATITLITAEDEKKPSKIGWQGLCGSREEALKLLGDAIVNMYPDHLKFDKEVTYMGM